MNVTKRDLGQGYVVTAGVLLSVALLTHTFVAIRTDLAAALVAAAGIIPSLALAGANYWLPTSSLDGEQIWTVAQWCGIGIAALTVTNVGVLVFGQSVSTMTPVILATGVALGGTTGALVGVLLELRRASRRLERGNAVLGRVIQHNLRNDLTVVLGHLGELERQVSGDTEERVQRLGSKIDDIVSTADKARQIDVALATDQRSQRPVDIVPHIQERLEAVERTYPESRIETDLPAHSWVVADWFVKTVLDNVVENVVDHAEGPPEFQVSVERDEDCVLVRIVDNCPPIPDNERAVFSGSRETPLDHSTGVGLWLVRLVMESYGGDVHHEHNDDGNTVVLRFEAATERSSRSLLGRSPPLGSR